MLSVGKSLSRESRPHTIDRSPDGDGYLATMLIYDGDLWIAQGHFR